MMYRVAWVIDVEADTPREAAEWAKARHSDGETIATVYEVTPWDGDTLLKNDTLTIDLMEELP